MVKQMAFGNISHAVPGPSSFACEPMGDMKECTTAIELQIKWATDETALQIRLHLESRASTLERLEAQLEGNK
jgi:hypothetical protein